jgi:hypothetical protein
VLRKIATLYEIETYWCLEDLIMAHQAMDVQDEIEEYHRKQAEKE